MKLKRFFKRIKKIQKKNIAVPVLFAAFLTIGVSNLSENQNTGNSSRIKTIHNETASRSMDNFDYPEDSLAGKIKILFDKNPVECGVPGTYAGRLDKLLFHNCREQSEPPAVIGDFHPPHDLLMEMENRSSLDIFNALSYLGRFDLAEVRPGRFRRISKVGAMQERGECPSRECAESIARGYMLATRAINVLVKKSEDGEITLGEIADNVSDDFKTILYDRLSVSLFQEGRVPIKRMDRMISTLNEEQKIFLFNHLNRFIRINRDAMKNACFLRDQTDDRFVQKCLSTLIQKTFENRVKMKKEMEEYNRFRRMNPGLNLP